MCIGYAVLVILYSVIALRRYLSNSKSVDCFHFKDVFTHIAISVAAAGFAKRLEKVCADRLPTVRVNGILQSCRGLTMGLFAPEGHCTITITLLDNVQHSQFVHATNHFFLSCKKFVKLSRIVCLFVPMCVQLTTD